LREAGFPGIFEFVTSISFGDIWRAGAERWGRTRALASAQRAGAEAKKGQQIVTLVA
jgi:hypothetical protein